MSVGVIDRAYLELLVAALRSQSDWCDRVDPGLTDAEVSAIEDRFQFVFPPDLRAVLQFALPVGKCFPDWRNDSEEALRRRLDWPLDGMWFDVRNKVFWPREWGVKPVSEDEQFEIVRHAVHQAPRLIPIFSHRYIPAEPSEAGNPVLSVYQTDIIYYGDDLADYFRREFGMPLPELAAREPRRIRFWTDVLEGCY
jgi:hypothetical protein